MLFFLFACFLNRMKMWNWIGKGDLEGDEEEEISSRKKLFSIKR